MKRINQAHIAALIPLINGSSFFELLGMTICELKEGYSKVEIQLDQRHLNPFGGVHGGVYASLIDTAAYWAAYCDMDENAAYTSMDVCVNNLSMMKEGTLIAEGRTIKCGRSRYLCEASITDSAGKLIAYGTSKLMVLQGRSVLQMMGVKALPCKFVGEDNEN